MPPHLQRAVTRDAKEAAAKSGAPTRDSTLAAGPGAKGREGSQDLRPLPQKGPLNFSHDSAGG